jgi:cell division septal protein FtsQ
MFCGTSHKSGQKATKHIEIEKKEHKFRNHSKTQTKYVLQISSLFLKTATTVIYGIAVYVLLVIIISKWYSKLCHIYTRKLIETNVH